MSIIAQKIEVKIDGKKLENYVFSDFRLTQELLKPNELNFRMYKNTMAENKDDIRFSLSKELLGKKIEFALTTKRSDEDAEVYEDKLEFTGIIFNAKLMRRNIKEGLNIMVTAYSPDELLNNNPHCYSYENETLKNVVDNIVKPYSALEITNDPWFVEEMQYTVQYNETHYQFLRRLAERFGQWLYYDGKKLVFGRRKKLDMLKLVSGYDVLSYQYRVKLQHFNFTHADHNYLDYNNNLDEVAPAEEDIHNMTDIAYKQSKDTFSEKTFQHYKGSAPEENFNEIRFSTVVQAEEEQGQLMICEGTSNRADLKIGNMIQIKETFKDEENETGSCAHDTLLIYGITHYMDMNGLYENAFTATANEHISPPYLYRESFPKTETQRAVVMDNIDPEKLGRVRVQFLWQKEQDENLMTPWIRIAQPHGGNNKGFYFIPEIDEEVMVGFENGNAEKPYVIGTLYHGKQRPGKDWFDENVENNVKAIRTRNGHTIEIHDENEGGYIRIYDHEKENYVLTFSTDKKLIRLTSAGNIELYAGNDIILDAQNNIKINAKNDISIDAKQNIDENAGQKVILGSGSTMDINAGACLTTRVGLNDYLYVGNNQFIEIGAEKEEQIKGPSYMIGVRHIVNTSGFQSYSGSSVDIIGEKDVKVDGGGLLDLYGGTIRMN